MSVDPSTRRVALLSIVAVPVSVIGRAAVLPLALMGILSMTSLTANRGLPRFIPWQPWRDDQQTAAVIGVAAVLGLLSLLIDRPLYLPVTALLMYGCGSLGATVVSVLPRKTARSVLGFCGGAWTASLLGQLVYHRLTGGLPVPLVEPVVLSTVGTLVGALAYVVLLPGDEWLSLPVATGSLWLVELGIGSLQPVHVLVALGLTITFGTIAFRLDAATVSGALAGGLCLVVTTVLGGLEWAFVLLVFIGSGSLLSRFSRSQTQPQYLRDRPARPRSAGNVLANAGASTGVVVLYALADPVLGADPRALVFAFVGGIAAATSDTVASEIGERYEHAWLITSRERVASGTDGAVSLPGTLAGISGAATIAVCATLVFTPLVLTDGLLLTALGTLGMLLDSVLGATLEGRWLANDGVNLVATTTIALVAFV